MSKIIHTGGGTFVDTDPIAAPDGQQDNPGVHIYAYAHFRSLEHVRYGLFRTTGGPEDEEIDSEEVGQYGMEPLASYWELDDALKEIGDDSTGRARRYAFEEVPFVEIETKDQYDEALEAIDFAPSSWEGPGLYDFRDTPPSFAGTVEDYELDEMKRAADDAFDFMFQGDEWEETYRALAQEEE